MTIKENSVSILLNGRNIGHYEGRGYEIHRRKDRWGDTTVPMGTYIEVRVEDLLPSSEAMITKICDYCGEEDRKKVMYCQVIKSRKKLNKDCCKKPECVSEKIKEAKVHNGIYQSDIKVNGKNLHMPKAGQSLSEKFPELLNQYHPTLNETSPDRISYGSDKVVWWICSKNPEHIWDDSVKHRTGREKRGCPYCAGRRINHTNSLRSFYPELSKEWHPYENGSTTPDNVSKSSEKIVWWICPKCTSEYDMSIACRTNSKQNCPYCAGYRFNHTNCLATTHPKLIKEWCHELNGDKTPYSISKGHSHKVWWRCSICAGIWDASPDSRTSMKSGCPFCNESKGEKRIRDFLNLYEINYERQYTYDDLLSSTGSGRHLRFDFAVFDYDDNFHCLIEYDGEYHFCKIYENDGHETLKLNDELKNTYCKKNNIKLIRIAYYDQGQIDSILKRELRELIHTYLKMKNPYYTTKKL
ncbi:zinc-ribbon domain-containing protein [Paenibacillus elgii]|uniref:zinc-ribbon domain-containing protein n=1 Tax=Paenibacillus elgii TaxID=189691 RepID=UPI0002FE365C|nr:zinc-ribbon domain-containing protein [Paenibacillus elgii]